MSIIGGRNIGDKYFAPESYKKPVSNDRDAIIINFSDQENVSAVDQMSQYFDEIWNHRHSKEVSLWTKRIFKRKAKDIANDMREKTNITRDRYKGQLEKFSDMYHASMPTNKVTFIHNPIERFSKEPWCWYELVQLFKGAKKSVFVQSPYVIPNRKMTKDFITTEDIEDKDITILTNSLASTPNLLAFSGYQNYRKKIVDHDINILEIQSVDSIHSKALVVDDDIVAIGSFNIDARSAFLSTESMVVIHSAEVVKEFAGNIVNYTDKSLWVNKDYKYKEDSKTKEKEVSFIKKTAVNLLSISTRLVDYLL